VIPAVLVGRVADHVAAVALVEVHVDVGHLLATGVQEALEEQLEADGIEVDDAQAVGDAAASGRTTAGADADAAFAGVADQVPDHEEVGRAARHVRRQHRPVALAGALVREMAEVLVLGGEPGRHLEPGQLGLAELDLDVGPLGDPEGVVTCFGQLPEQLPHLGGRLQVVLLPLEPEPLGVVDRRAGLHAQQGVVGDGVLPMDVMTVVGGQQRRVQAPGDLEELGVRALLFVEAVILQLDEQVVGSEDVLEAPGQLERLLVLTLEQGLEDDATEAPRGGNHTLVVPLEQLPIHPRAVVVALEEGGR